MLVARRVHMDFDQVVNWFVHTVSGGAILASIAGFLPFLFAVPAFLYYCLLLSRDPTIKGWFARRRRRRIAQLTRRIKELENADHTPE